jgi:hypothetical protein
MDWGFSKSPKSKKARVHRAQKNLKINEKESPVVEGLNIWFCFMFIILFTRPCLLFFAGERILSKYYKRKFLAIFPG